MNLSEQGHWRSALVADLAFILLSPSLITESNTKVNFNTLETIQWLEGIDKDDTSLRLFIEGNNARKLGWYAEQLMSFFFKNNPLYRLLGNNIQLFDGKTTIGEIDFIIEDIRSKEIFQLELATKFYLYYDLNEPIFIGPNSHDNFDRKFYHLTEKQLKPKESNEIIQITGNRKIDFQVPLMKGILFYPLNQQKIDTYFSYINPNHQRGWYTNLSGLLSSKDINELYATTKLDWLSMSAKKRISRDKFQAYFSVLFEEGHRAVMVKNNKDERGLIIPDSWPN